jgi:hypothetical protein
VWCIGPTSVIASSVALAIPDRQISHRTAGSSVAPEARVAPSRLMGGLAVRLKLPGFPDSRIGCLEAGALEMVQVPVVSKDQVAIQDLAAAPGALCWHIELLSHKRPPSPRHWSRHRSPAPPVVADEEQPLWSEPPRLDPIGFSTHKTPNQVVRISGLRNFRLFGSYLGPPEGASPSVSSGGCSQQGWWRVLQLEQPFPGQSPEDPTDLASPQDAKSTPGDGPIHVPRTSDTLRLGVASIISGLRDFTGALLPSHRCCAQMLTW